MPQQAKTLLMGAAVGLLLGVLSVQWQPQGATSHRDALPQAAVKVVNRATELINEMDYRAFEIFDRDAFFNLGDRYVFVLAADGTVIYHAADRSQIGADFAALRDIDRRPFGRHLITDVSPDGVWSAYHWRNPISQSTAWKLTFTRQTRQGHIVGAGIFATSD